MSAYGEPACREICDVLTELERYYHERIIRKDDSMYRFEAEARFLLNDLQKHHPKIQNGKVPISFYLKHVPGMLKKQGITKGTHLETIKTDFRTIGYHTGQRLDSPMGIQYMFPGYTRKNRPTGA